MQSEDSHVVSLFRDVDIREVKGGHVTRWTNLFFPPAVLLYAIYIIACTLLK